MEKNLAALFAASTALAAIGCSKPDAMTFCGALEQRDLARECKKDTSIERGNAATFKTRDGSEGRVLLTSDEDYMATLNGPVGPHPGWNAQEAKGEIYLAASRGGDGKPAVLIRFPPTLDVFDRDEFTRFTTSYIDEVAKGNPVPKRAVQEHPKRSSKCEAESGCKGAGLCSAMPSKPENCVAAFDSDCKMSKNCEAQNLCRADSSSLLCKEGPATRR